MSAVTTPLHTTWDEAEPTLRLLIAQTAAGLTAPRPVVVGITGPVGSGKTTLARQLGGVLLSTDHYLPDYADLPEAERDEPRHADLGLLATHLGTLRQHTPIDRPEWCFHEHRRIGTRRVEPGPLVVCEGIFALQAQIQPHLDLAVFVDAPAEVRWARWEQLETSGERGWGVERARQYFTRVAEPTFARFAGQYRAAADVVVCNDREINDRAISDREKGPRV